MQLTAREKSFVMAVRVPNAQNPVGGPARRGAALSRFIASACHQFCPSVHRSTLSFCPRQSDRSFHGRRLIHGRQHRRALPGRRTKTRGRNLQEKVVSAPAKVEQEVKSLKEKMHPRENPAYFYDRQVATKSRGKAMI